MAKVLLPSNASTKRYHKTQALMEATRPAGKMQYTRIIRSYQLEVSYCTNYSTKAPDLCKACHKLYL